MFPLSVKLYVLLGFTEYYVLTLNNIFSQGELSVSNGDDVLLIGTIATYNIYVNSSVFVRTSCDSDECKYMIYLPSDICSASTLSNINITISTENVLGEGPSADLIIIGMQSISY